MGNAAKSSWRASLLGANHLSHAWKMSSSLQCSRMVFASHSPLQPNPSAHLDCAERQTVTASSETLPTHQCIYFAASAAQAEIIDKIAPFKLVWAKLDQLSRKRYI